MAGRALHRTPVPRGRPRRPPPPPLLLLLLLLLPHALAQEMVEENLIDVHRLLSAGAMPGAGAGAGVGAGNAEGGLKPTAPVVDLSVHLEQSASLSPQHLSLNISWTPPTEGELPEGKDMPRGFTVNILLLNSTRADCTPNARFPTFYAVHLDSPWARTVLVPEELMPGALLIRPGCTYNVTVESEPYLGGQVPHQVYVVPRSPISNAVSVEDTEIDDPVDDGSSRILYGNKVPQGSDIYQAAVLENMRHAGIGSIINEKFVITAATTVTTSSGSAKSARNFRIGVGYVDLNVYNETITYSVARFYIHEEFNITTMQNNIALVRISDYFKYSGTVFPIKLGYSWHTQMDLRCTTLGYGQIWSTPGREELYKEGQCGENRIKGKCFKLGIKSFDAETVSTS